MGYLDLVQSAIDYIEENLKAEITPEELAARAGFSLYHYYRVFQSAVGMPVMRYITRRRLLWAAYEIANGKKQVEAAYDYGFDTSAGFYKAFCREFGCAPYAYVKRFRIRKPYRIHLLQEESIMISNARIKSVLRNWALQDTKLQSVVATDEGNIRENTFYVGRELALKAYSSPGTAIKSGNILSALSDLGLGSGKPVKTKAGEDLATDGELYYLLTPRIRGTEFDVEALFGDQGFETSRYLGQIIGKLHLALKAMDDTLCDERDIYREVCEVWLQPAAAAVGLPERFCRDYKDTFGRLHEKLPVQIIHRDPNPSNILMDRGTVAGFVDFDLSQRSIRLFDPCYTATAVLSSLFMNESSHSYTQWLDVFQGILQGYDDVVKLTEEEKQAIGYVVLSIQLICVGYFSGCEKYSELAGANKEMLLWLMDQMETLNFLATNG